jgi:uncharacterized protein DUF6448
MKIAPLFPLLALAVISPGKADAHCDTLDGPVVRTARTALESGKMEPVLAWVQPGDEAEIRDAFARARAVRGGGKEAADLADLWFFETVVRIHRAGEGAPFTGLKPAGAPGPAVAAADRAISGGDAKKLENLLVNTVHEGLDEHWAQLKKEKPPAADVAAGRRWVAAYVSFVHWAEGVYAAASGARAHGAEPAEHHGAEHGERHEPAATAKADAH